MVSESWFRNLWRFPKKHDGHKDKEGVVLGVLAFEVASLLSKLVHLWKSLSDKNVAKLRNEITHSTGIKKLVSEDDDFVVRLIHDEMMDNVENIAKAIARFASKCNDPKLKSFWSCFSVMMMKTGTDDPYGWQFKWKEMNKKVKKMERFIASNASLYQETEILTDLEQSFKRMKSNNGSATDNNLLEYQKKVTWKTHEVRNLRDVSLWNRTYDYTVLLLVRSVFTIFSRTKYVFGISYRLDPSDDVIISSSVPRFASGPLGRRFTGSVATKETKMSDFLSGSLSGESSQFVQEKSKRFRFYSGPLSKMVGQNPDKPAVKKQSKPNRLTHVGPFKGCMVSQDEITNSVHVENLTLPSRHKQVRSVG